MFGMPRFHDLTLVTPDNVKIKAFLIYGAGTKNARQKRPNISSNPDANDIGTADTASSTLALRKRTAGFSTITDSPTSTSASSYNTVLPTESSDTSSTPLEGEAGDYSDYTIIFFHVS